MKKPILFFLLICIAATAFGQITLTSSSIPTPGIVIFTIDADSSWTAGLTMTAAGPNQTWDFSGAVAAGPQYPEFYLAPATTPHAASFPLANLASTYEISDTAEYTYIKTTANGVFLLGTKSSTGGGLNFSSPLKVAGVPFAYQNTFTQLDTISGTFGTYSVTGTANQTVLADAWGTVTTPLGSFPCLRIKTTMVENVTIFGFIPGVLNSVSYQWWSTQYKAPLFTYTTSSTTVLGQTTNDVSSSYLSNQTTAVGDPKANAANLTIAPNPAQGSTTLVFTAETSGKADLLVYSTDGKLIKADRGFDVIAGENSRKLDLQGIAPGSYMAVLMIDNKPFSVQQVSVQ